MKLYELTRGEYFKLAGADDSPVFQLDHIDGMYSVCYYEEGGEKRLIHLAASAPVIRIKENE